MKTMQGALSKTRSNLKLSNPARSKLLFLPLLFIATLSHTAAQQKQESPIDSRQPLQVDLLAPLDVGKQNPGARIFAKARVEWRTPTCQMRTGAAVSGHVINVVRHSKASKAASITVLFDTVDCNGHPAHIPFDLFAVIAAIQAPRDIPLADYGMFGAASTAPHTTMGASPGAAHMAVPMDHNQDIAVTAAGKTLNLPAVIQSGQVFGQKNLLLAVGTGLEGGSILSSPQGNFRVESGAQLVLMPKPVLSPEAVAAAASGKPSSAPIEVADAPKAADTPLPPPPPKPEVDETDICTSPCAVLSPSDETNLASAGTASVLSAARFGYLPYEKREYNALNHEAALFFLDDHSLLFTFDLHRIRHRYRDGIRTESIRTVRAVIVDPSSHQMKRVSDWQVQGAGQYLWPMSHGRLLVHIGHALYLMNSHLQPLGSAFVPGQLVFVSLSPDGTHIAVGTLHERHTREIHDQLAELIHSEPEEDVDIQLFDDNFKLLLTSYQSTSHPPPVLSDAGEIRILSTGRNHWRIQEYSWDRTERIIANLLSACRPEISTPLPQSLFIVGCNTSPLRNWYRVLRSDGHPILLNPGSSREIEQSASSNDENQLAVRIVHTEHAEANGDYFRREDLLTQQISVFRSADGKRLFGMSANASLVEQSYALSPSGDRLAVLTDGRVFLYALPASRDPSTGAAQ
jgi:hypothetical protein